MFTTRKSQLAKKIVGCGVLLSMFLATSVSAQDSKTRRINCDGNNNKTINKLINKSNPGDTILIRGTCFENVDLNKGVTLNGNGVGVIVPADSLAPTIRVSARNATIKGLTIDAPKEGTQILITDRSLATIENNNIGNATVYGIAAFDMSSASIVGNNIYNNGTGVFAVETSTLRVGFKSMAANELLPNVIENNNNGITIARAFANISGNQIINNTNIGVVIARTASARIAGNEISGNNIGIVNTTNSTTDLALSDDGVGLFGLPNFGVNTQLALFCNSGFTSGIVGPDFNPAIAQDSCESQLIFPVVPVPPPAPAPAP